MSPTKTCSTDLMQKDDLNIPMQTQQTIRKSPKKRPLKRYTMVSSSSSTESLTSDTKGNRIEECTQKYLTLLLTIENQTGNQN